MNQWIVQGYEHVITHKNANAEPQLLWDRGGVGTWWPQQCRSTLIYILLG